MSFVKRMKSEIIETTLILVIAALVGTWMTAKHRIRDLNHLLDTHRSEVEELIGLEHQLVATNAPETNIAYLRKRLSIELARYNYHVDFYNNTLTRPVFKQLASRLPVQEWQAIQHPSADSLEVITP